VIGRLGLAGQISKHVDVIPSRTTLPAVRWPSAGHVISLEIYPDIALAARRNLACRGVANVLVITADCTEG
jgi:predicted O-methyltransferase YrrM